MTLTNEYLSVTWTDERDIPHFAAWNKGTCPNIGTKAENAVEGFNALLNNMKEYINDCEMNRDAAINTAIVLHALRNKNAVIHICDTEIFA